MRGVGRRHILLRKGNARNCPAIRRVHSKPKIHMSPSMPLRRSVFMSKESWVSNESCWPVCLQWSRWNIFTCRISPQFWEREKTNIVWILWSVKLRYFSISYVVFLLRLNGIPRWMIILEVFSACNFSPWLVKLLSRWEARETSSSTKPTWW